MPRAMTVRRITRACDECKVRKVKCDTSVPQCSNCRVSNLSCTHTTPVRKRGPRIPKAQPEISLNNEEETSWSASPALDNPVHQDLVLTPSSRTTAIVLDVPLSQSVLSKDCSTIQHQLLSTIRALNLGVSLDHLVSQCLDSYMQYIFPLAPVIHERTMRANIALFDPNTRWLETSPAYSPLNNGCTHDTQVDKLARARLFILMSAVCATSTICSPVSISSADSTISTAFLEASRKMLALYYEEDVVFPNSSSVVCRILQSSASHSAGKVRLSWIILGEAVRLAQDMQLHAEASLVEIGPLEAQLRHNACSLLYVADRSAAILNQRPITFGELNLESWDPAPLRTWDETPLMDDNKAYDVRHFEHRIAIGFSLSRAVWQSASKLLLELRLLQRRFEQHPTEELPNATASTITEAYLDFMSVLDNTPAWLTDTDARRLPEESTLSEEQFRCLSRCIWVQRANLQVTFHCLRLIILQKAADCKVLSLLGVSDRPALLALKKTEIAQDMLRIIQSVPLESLKTNGESCAEKIRQVGASLLEIAQSNQIPQVAARAKTDFATLLDILTSLDSRGLRELCLS